MPTQTLPVSVGVSYSAVTPSDTTVLPFAALYIGTTGNVAVVPPHGGTAVTFNAVPVGFFPVAGSKVMSTNTTASNIVAIGVTAYPTTLNTS